MYISCCRSTQSQDQGKQCFYVKMKKCRINTSKFIKACIQKTAMLQYFFRQGEKKRTNDVDRNGSRQGRKGLHKRRHHKGRSSGLNDVNALNECLLRDGRIEDLKRSVTDTEFQEKLCNEYFPERD